LDIDDQQAKEIGYEVFSKVLNHDFSVSGKKEFQIGLLKAMVKAGLLDLTESIPTEVSLRLGMDPKQLERLAYTTYLNSPELQNEGLLLNAENLTEWNATTKTDVKNEEIRFEVPSQVARVKLEQYFKEKGINVEKGRSNYILFIKIERVASACNNIEMLSDDTMVKLRKDYSSIAESLEQASTSKEKIITALKSGSSFVIHTVFAALIEKNII
jgi:hypothetical protein